MNERGARARARQLTSSRTSLLFTWLSFYAVTNQRSNERTSSEHIRKKNGNKIKRRVAKEKMKKETKNKSEKNKQELTKWASFISCVCVCACVCSYILFSLDSRLYLSAILFYLFIYLHYFCFSLLLGVQLTVCIVYSQFPSITSHHIASHRIAHKSIM